MAVAGYATFPGVSQVLQADFTLSHGITPSTCTMQIVPQTGLPFREGALVFLYGGTQISFPGCKVDSAQIQLNSSGQIVTLTIMDRRWRWAYGEVAGVFNDLSAVRQDPSVYRITQAQAYLETLYRRSARQLVEHCLSVMGGGERGYDVSAVPNNTYPPTVWDGATNAAQAMQQLLDPLALRVVLNNNNTISIVQQGVGAQPPSGALMEDTGTATPPTVPSQIQVVCGKSRFQNDLPLRPVGLDFDPVTATNPVGGNDDGIVKPIHQLSYKPSTGWGNHNPQNFNALSRVPQGPQRKSARDLATATVWRWYRIFSVHGGDIRATNLPRRIIDIRNLPDEIGFDYAPNFLPGYDGEYRSIWQILPLQNEKLEVYAYEGGVRPRPSEVWGNFYIRRYLPANWNISRRLWFGGFGLDAKRGIVQFGEPVYLNGGTVEFPRYAAASIRLSCSYNVREINNGWAHHRYSRSVQVPGGDPSLPAKVITQDEIEYQVIASWTDLNNNSADVVSVRDNKANIDPWINYYLNAELRKLQNRQQRQLKYIGIVPVNLNGLVQQITWSVGPQGATTKVGLNTEYSIGQPRYETRRLFETLRNDQFRLLQQRAVAQDRLRFNNNR